jgi:hypothetical protein
MTRLFLVLLTLLFSMSGPALGEYSDFGHWSNAANGGGATWNNGWRTANGKFASPNGAGRSGAAAEQSVWDAVNQKPGWSVIEGQVGVRNDAWECKIFCVSGSR